jgi:hypothetical protein
MKNFNKRIFKKSIIIVGILLFFSFLAAWQIDEGWTSAEVGPVTATLSKLFNILRFPTHALFWNFFSGNAVLFFLGLFINCIFYGFIIERIISLFAKPLFIK